MTKRMHIPQYNLPILGLLVWSSLSIPGGAALLADDKSWDTMSPAKNTPATTPDKPAPKPAPTAATSTPTSAPDKTTDKVADKPAPAPAPDKPTPIKPGTVDQIKGIGKFNLGQNITEFPPGLLRVVDPRASGVLLRVSPYGENYLVTDVKDMTWAGIPISGMVITFHAGILIDIQVALKAKKFDFYVADRTFKTKYGPNDPKTFPVETWKGNQIVMTLIFPGANITDANSLDAMSQGKIDLFDQGQWNKFETARTAELKDIVEKRYQTAVKNAQDNL